LDQTICAMDVLVELVKARDRAEYRVRNADVPRETVDIEFVPRTHEQQRGEYYPKVELIQIHRYGCTYDDPIRPASELAAESPCALEELVTFAHELGHHEARLAGRPCSAEDASASETYALEVWAWEFARAILAETTMFAEWAYFEERFQKDLGGYRSGLSELISESPDEIESQVRQDSPGVIDDRRPTGVAPGSPAAGTSDRMGPLS
jgi:hypothetical protein